MKEKDDDKVETSPIHIRTSPENLDSLKGNDYKQKKAAKKIEEYLSPADLTALKLRYVDSHFPKNINVSIFAELVRQDSEAKNYISDGLFNKLDLSYGKRGDHYNTRIESEMSGMISDIQEKYFFNFFNDTLLVACNLLAIDNEELLKGYRYKNKRGIKEIKEYFENLPIYFEESVEGILEAILTGEISEAKAHIYIEFIHEVVVEKNNSMYKYIVKYNEEFKEALDYFLNLKMVKIDEVSLKEIEETQKYL